MKKRKHRRKAWKIVLAVLAVVILFAAIVVFGFRTRSIEVEGNEYYGESSILAWIENDKLSVNTLYLFLKYNYLGADVPTAVESMTVSLKNPWTVHVTVREKEMLGYVDYDGAFLYFDRDGIIVESSGDKLPGVPWITGLDFRQIVLYKPLPVEDPDVFQEILNLTQQLSLYEIPVDRIQYDSEGQATLYIRSMEVTLGDNRDIDGKISTLNDILTDQPQLMDMEGVLELENYTESNSHAGITFRRK